MSTRGVIEMRFTNEIEKGAPWRSLFLYQHWDGDKLVGQVRDCLMSSNARACWDDRPYLARVIVDQITRLSRDANKNHGLSPFEVDHDGPVRIVILMSEQSVLIDGAVLSFAAFVGATS